MRTPKFAMLLIAGICSTPFGTLADEPKLPEILLWDANATNEGDPKPQALKTRIYPLPKNTPIVVKFDMRCVKTVKFTETARSSVLDEDLAALIKKLAKAAGDVGPCPTDLAQRRLDGVVQYVPKFERSTIKATAVDQDAKELGGETIYYGPEEHLHLSIDLPVTNRDTLKYDDASHSLVPKEDKPQVYLSINYRVGDLLDKPKTIMDRAEIKVAVLASRKPLDSYGVGIGARLDDLHPFSLELKGLSIFAGYFRTKEDTIADGVPVTNGATKNSWRFGVSYDLGTGLKWAGF